jgi:exodeoxyribonuclease X
MKLAIIDCETTGKEEDSELLELACITLEPPSMFRRAGSILVRPLGPIPPEASAVHHITASMLDNALTRDQASAWIKEKVQGCVAVVAHHIAFDQTYLPELNHLPWVCTLNVAKHIWPDAPSYGLQVLRYWRGLPAENARGLPHRAIYDASCTAWLVAEQLAVVGSLEKMIELTGKIALLRGLVHFGKYRNKKTWEEMVRTDRSYSNWVLNMSDMGSNPEVRHTLLHYMDH